MASYRLNPLASLRASLWARNSARCFTTDLLAFVRAGVAVVALHHVEPLERSCAHLASLVAPGGRLVVDEVDAAGCDERAATWWLGQRRTLGGEEAENDPLSLVAARREQVHPLASIPRRPDAVLRAGAAVLGCLHRWDLAGA